MPRSTAITIVLGTVFATACSVTTNGNAITIKPKTRYQASSPVTKTASVSWSGQPIEIENANGTVTVNGDPSATTVSVSAIPFSMADVQADGDAGITDVSNTIAVDVTSVNIYAHCAQATQDHASAPASLTGCDLTVTIPAGSAAQGLKLRATARNGSITATNLTAASGEQLQILSDNGDVTATNVTGGVQAHTKNGNVTASYNIVKGANYEASTENGDATLSLPGTFATDSLVLQGSPVDVGPFKDLTSTSASRGQAGVGASSIKVVATGTVTLAQQ